MPLLPPEQNSDTVGLTAVFCPAGIASNLTNTTQRSASDYTLLRIFKFPSSYETDTIILQNFELKILNHKTVKYNNQAGLNPKKCDNLYREEKPGHERYQLLYEDSKQTGCQSATTRFHIYMKLGLE